ncbi:MAG: hypothetical protein RIE73_36405 [Coleofasciculus sp. C1-SOL-03]
MTDSCGSLAVALGWVELANPTPSTGQVPHPPYFAPTLSKKPDMPQSNPKLFGI